MSPHWCNPPEPFRPVLPLDDGRRRHGVEVTLCLPVGSRHVCPACGTIWVLHFTGDPTEGPGSINRIAWAPETRAERRARLGIPRWQVWR